ncbi:hypothetical protein BU17DRAFT_38435 [Hysterangium stoloniferum]|nr:hypothetical protein BU17DRAFT_38435 [Hysterangium stoloniferum]
MDALGQLPNEVLEDILLYIPALPRSATSVKTIYNFGLGNSRFLAVSRLSSVWKSHYETRWLRSDPVREEERRLQTENNFWKMYNLRNKIDFEILSSLGGIISDTENREALALDVVNRYRYDVWDVLSAELEYSGQGTRDPSNVSSELDGIPVAGLTRRYWARELLDVFARLHAVNTWLRGDASFEKGLACLSSFISDEFHILTQSCRAFLSDHGIADDSDLEDVATLICSWMRSRGFVKPNMVNYHDIINHFPHHILFVQEMALPISLVYVFVCIARRLGYDAHPVAFPYKVLALISPRNGNPVYVDVFDSATRPILTYNGDLLHMLETQGFDTNNLAQYASPAPTAAMLLRTTGNFRLSRPRSRNDLDRMAARYAACCVALIFSDDARLVEPMLLDGMRGPLDAEVVVRNALRPNVSLAAQQEIDIHLPKPAATIKEKGEPRLRGRTAVKHHVGTIFRHKTYGYNGLIKSWDYSCKATDEWIRTMRVGDLPRGRDQPFYHSYMADGQIRYVAEENMEPLSNPSLEDIGIFIRSNEDLGRWFDGVKISSSGTVKFILSPESRMVYPDDDL